MHAVPLQDGSAIEPPVTAPVRDLRRVPIHPDHWYPLAGASCAFSLPTRSLVSARVVERTEAR